MKTPQELKPIVRQKYSEIAAQDKALNKACCVRTKTRRKKNKIKLEMQGLRNACAPGSGCC